MIVDKLVEDGIFSEETIELKVEGSNNFKLKRLEFEIKLKQIELHSKESQKKEGKN